MNIPVIKDKEKANFPFVVEYQNTENWSASTAGLSLPFAMNAAEELKRRCPTLPVRIRHFTGGGQVSEQLPLWKYREQPKEVPSNAAIWTGKDYPPKVGERIQIQVNNIGPATVTGYTVVEGYLGLMVRADEVSRPAWHKKSWPNNEPSVVYGAEIAPL